MLHRIRKFLCLHIFEYEIGENLVLVKECRKCGVHH